MEGGAEVGGAGVHVGEAVAGAGGCGIEAGAVVVDGKSDTGGRGREMDQDFGRGAVTEGVAEGFAGDLQKLDGVGGRKKADGGFVDLVVEIDLAGGGEFVGDGAEGRGEVGGGEIFGSEADDVSADVADAAVEGFAGGRDAGFGGGGIGGDERAGGFEGEAGGVERLDDAVVEIATEPDFFLQGAIEELLGEKGVGFGALADVAFVGEFAGLGDGGFGELRESADFGAREIRVKRCAGVGGARAAESEAGEERGGEDDGGEGEWKREATGEVGEAGGRRSRLLTPTGRGRLLVIAMRTSGEKEDGQRDEDKEEDQAEDAREGVHAAGARMTRGCGGSKGIAGQSLIPTGRGRLLVATSRNEQNFRHLETVRFG